MEDNSSLSYPCFFGFKPSELWRSVLAFIRKAVRKRSRLVKPPGLGSLEGLSSMESAFPVSFFTATTDGLELGRRTRSSKLSFWLKRDKRENNTVWTKRKHVSTSK